MRIVVDASSLIDYVLRTRFYERFSLILEQPDSEWHIPMLCDIEFTSFLRTMLRSGRVEQPRAMIAIEAYLDLPLIRHRHEDFLIRVLELRENFSAYDAAYVALAETLEAALVTSDEALARAVRRHLKLQVLP